ncbi:uncharacterized protein LOC107362664 [Tetranychus urticae]|uniref:Tudor domain-containing protein n=1 Tax=Tetranychus urticae TaxID=32264 RepID=T1KC23_TETUR|nr:uncharacterized protein LOC107362664 [Tetranychus urticae]
MSLYRCVNKFCEENLDYNPGVANEVILNDREKEIPFNARILLTCGHSICEKCIYGIAVKNQNFYKCDDCGKTTSFSQRTIDKVRNNKPKLNPIVRWNEDGADDLNYEAFSIGAAFNSGRISVSSTPVVDLDELGQAEIPTISVHSYRDEPEVTSIPAKISNAPDNFKAIINDAVSMYRLCGKSLKHLFDAKAAVNKKYVSTKEAIRKRFHILHGLLQLQEANLVKELKKSKNNNIKTLAAKEKEVDGVRSHLKNQILRSPQFAFIQSGNPVKHEIASIRPKRLKIERVDEIPDYLSSLNKPHDEIRETIVKLTDFSKAVNFEVKIAFAPLISTPGAYNTPNTPNTPAVHELNISRKSAQTSIMHIPFIKQQLATIHDVKDSGYFDAHLPIDKSASSSLNKAINSRISVFLHPPISSKIKPQSSYIVWHDQKKEWVRAKLTRLEECPDKSEKENFCLLPHSFKPKRAAVLLTDYNNEIYKTRLENLRESTAELSDINIYPRLLKVWKCRLQNVQADSSAFRKYVLQFCPNNITVKLLILSEPNSETYTYDVDVVHNISEPCSHQPTLIEYLIYANVAKLRDGRAFPYRDPHLLKNFKEPPGFSPGPAHSVDVTYIKTPNHFYVNSARERQEIDNLEAKLADKYKDPILSVAYRLYYPRVGFPCAARCALFFDKNKKEKTFRRGSITSIEKKSDGSAERIVFYAVDYGEHVNVTFSDLRIIPESFVKFPIQAFKCSLANIQPKVGSWGANAIKEFQSYFQAVNILTSIIVVDKSAEMHNVILTIHNFHGDEDGIINDILIKNGFAVKPTPVLRTNNDANNTNPLASRSSPNRVNKYNFSCYNLLREMVSKFKRYHLTTIDSLIQVRVTSFNSPGSFFIQINSPEVRTDIGNFMKRLDEEYSGVDVTTPNSSAYQGFPVGEVCMYLYRPKHLHSAIWRRGLVQEFIGGGLQQSSSDPRAKNQVTGDSKYKLRDRDFGIDVEIQRKYMRCIPPSHHLRRDGEKCIECFIAGIKPADNTWSSRAIEHCKEILAKPTIELFIKIEDILDENQPQKIPVDLIFKTHEAPSIFEPAEDHYFSLRYELIECNFARMLSDELQYDKEIEADDDSKYIDRKMPQHFSDDSSISTLKLGYYSDDQATEAIKYMEAEKPASADFSAICTSVDEGPAIWFTIKSDSPKDPNIGTINKVILRALIQKEKFETFKGNADIGRACIVYNDNRWWRGTIQENIGNKINVLYIDTGAKRDHFIEDLSSEIFCEGIPGLALFGKLYKCVTFSKRPRGAQLLKSYLNEHVSGKVIRVHWENFKSDRDMLISVELEEENSDLKSQLLAYDLIEETEEVLEDHPHYIQTSLKLMEKSQYSFPSYEFSPDIFYPVIIGDLAVENYLCLQLTWFTNVDSAEKEDINDLCNKFVQDEDRIKAEYRGFQKAVDFPVGSSCCALWNGEWFRGIVSDVVETRAQYKVFFVDWGNSDIIKLQDMRIIPDDLSLRGRPIFGFFVRLSNIRPARNGIWTKRLFDMMKRAVEDSAGSSYVIKVKSMRMPFDVELWIADDDQRPVELLFQNLIEDGHLETC